MFFLGPDAAFALHGFLALTEAAVVHTHQQQNPPSYDALESAWVAIAETGMDRDGIEMITVIDFTKPSYVERMDVYQRDQCRPERFLCAHGRNTGDIYAQKFSNTVGSKQTSLGLFRVGQAYSGQWGVSLKLHGLQPGVNDKAYDRHIVLHSAWYVSTDVIYQNIAEGYGPRIGRSLGCPAVSQDKLSRVRELLQPGALIYIHGHHLDDD